LRDLKGRTAFVTGGAGGIGFELTKLFLAEGMNVVIADIEKPALESALEALKSHGARLRGAICDTAKRDSLEKAAGEAFAAFGAVHVVCNNAGVGGGAGAMDEFSDRHWDWVMAVNLMGVVHGIAIFLPHMRGHGEGGHFLNTASMAGMVGQPYGGPYSASKFAVVGVSETLFYELRGSNIGVSVLCPGFAKTRITESERNRPADLAEDGHAAVSQAAAAQAAYSVKAVATGIEASEVGARALEGIKDGDLYIFTHPAMRGLIDKRFQRIAAAYDKAERYADRSDPRL
jgi:NAD(P)-dependent dehydrogenase (short-subunit alcohol dehydrogenase family)